MNLKNRKTPAQIILIVIVPILVLTSGCNDKIPLRSFYTAQITIKDEVPNPFTDVDLTAVFICPGGDSIRAGSFYDGNNTFKFRAYCGETGNWKWVTSSNNADLDGKQGKFKVKPSGLKGKLKIDRSDPYQFMYDDGSWFLHIGETGYRYLVDTEKYWKEYIDQAAKMGATKIRCWFARSRHTVEALFNKERTRLDLNYWQEMEKRLNYALEKYPDIIFELIPFAEDDQELLNFRNGDPMSVKAIEYMQARWSAYPNIYYCISNDRDINRREELKEAVGMIGAKMAAEEPWGTLITNHQKRYQGYSFVDARWSDIITLEDIDQVDGRIVLEYRTKGKEAVVLDEDRYENWRNPENDRYYFRRLMWANLLSGGHPTYGGLRTYEAFVDTLTPSGIMGYYRANHLGLLEEGAHDFNYIHDFFTGRKIDLVSWIPSDSLAGDNPALFKCIRKGNNYIIYLQNPDDPVNHATAGPADEIPEVILDLPTDKFHCSWYCPRTGTWYDPVRVNGGTGTRLKAPGGKDWVLLVSPGE